MTTLRNNAVYKSKTIFTHLKRKLTLNSLIVVLISMVLFVVVIYYKEKIGAWIFDYVGVNFVYGYVNDEGIRVVWHFETYMDSQIYYELFTYSFLFEGWNPYVYSPGFLNNYMYGPVFIYCEVIFYYIVSIFIPNSTSDIIVHEAVKWNALTFDTLCVIMLYVLIINLKSFKKKKITKHIVGILGALALAFSPVNVYYIDAYFLNIPQMTFFTLLTFYLFMKEKYTLSSIFLSLAWLTKQIPLFFLIPLFLMLLRKTDVAFALKKFLIPHIITCMILSIPWIFITPLLYIGRIIGSGRPLWYVSLEPEARAHGTTLAHSFAYMNCDVFSYVILYLNIAMIPFLMVFLMGTFMSHFKGKEIISDEFNFYIFMNWFIIILHTFLSRGIFKYYDAFLNPFMIIASLLVIDKIISLIREKNHKKDSSAPHSEKDISFEHSKRNKIKQDILFQSLLIISFLVSIACLYGINWWFMIIIRFMHPMLLLGLSIVTSVTMPFFLYKSLFVKGNYKQLGKDIKRIFVISFQKLKKIFRKLKKKKKVKNSSEKKIDETNL